MKRLALVTAFPPSTGSLNEYGFHLANAIAERADVEKLIILADRLDTPAEELNLSDKIEVRRVWSFNQILTPLKIARAARKADVDGVIYNLQTASFGDREIPAALGLLAPAMTRLFGTRTGVIAHNLIDAIEVEKTAVGSNPVRAFLIRTFGKVITHALLKANYLTTTLDSFSEILEEKYGAKNAYMVPHGTFPSTAPAPTPVATRDMTICTMGKFGTYKRLERLIAAFKRVQAQTPSHELKLKIGGSDHPSTPGYLADLKAKHEGDTDIEFIGYIAEEDVASFFTSSRLAVFDYESTTGSSGVLHQSAGFGTPAAYPMIGDFIDVTMREGLSGYNYDAFDEASLAEAIEKAMFETELSDQMVAANLAVSDAMPMSTIAAFHAEMLSPQRQRVFKLRTIEDVRSVV